jgi:hypothetical protein
MTVGLLLAVLCILLGFVGAIVDEKILLGALEWFVAAIAIALTLGGVGPALFGGTRGTQ